MTDDDMRSILDQIDIKNVYLKTALSREEAIALLKDAATEAHIEECLDTYESHREDILSEALQDDIEKAAIKWEATLVEAGEEDDLDSYHHGGYFSGGRYYQQDWDIPNLAGERGFSLERSYESCRHSGSDGTVDCPDCGKTVSDFISECVEYLDYLV